MCSGYACTCSYHPITNINIIVFCVSCSAGVLIIWDRMFGTFQPESEKVVYGLVHLLATWDPLWAQIHHFVYIIKNIWSHQGLRGKLSFLFNGPGWSPGKPRLGCIEDKPHVSLFMQNTINFTFDVRFLLCFVLVTYSH